MDKPLRVGTFNIRWADPNDGEHVWDQRKPRLLAMLRGWNPEVLALQEALSGPLAEIRQTLPQYERVGAGRDDGADAGEHCPIFYKSARLEKRDSGTFWYSETPDVPGSRGWGCRHARICTWVTLRERETGSAFTVYNSHWDHEMQVARENSAALLLDRVRRHTVPVIVLGDFNAEADNPAVARLSSALTGVLPSPSTGTFHGFTGEAMGTPIDHIFVSLEWEVLDAEIVVGDGTRPFLSDHFAVEATVQRA